MWSITTKYWGQHTSHFPITNLYRTIKLIADLRVPFPPSMSWTVREHPGNPHGNFWRAAQHHLGLLSFWCGCPTAHPWRRKQARSAHHNLNPSFSIPLWGPADAAADPGIPREERGAARILCGHGCAGLARGPGRSRHLPLRRPKILLAARWKSSFKAPLLPTSAPWERRKARKLIKDALANAALRPGQVSCLATGPKKESQSPWNGQSAWLDPKARRLALHWTPLVPHSHKNPARPQSHEPFPHAAWPRSGFTRRSVPISSMAARPSPACRALSKDGSCISSRAGLPWRLSRLPSLLPWSRMAAPGAAAPPRGWRRAVTCRALPGAAEALPGAELDGHRHRDRNGDRDGLRGSALGHHPAGL